MEKGAAAPQLPSQKLLWRIQAKPNDRPSLSRSGPCAFWSVVSRSPLRFHREDGRTGGPRGPNFLVRGERRRLEPAQFPYGAGRLEQQKPRVPPVLPAAPCESRSP